MPCCEAAPDPVPMLRIAHRRVHLCFGSKHLVAFRRRHGEMVRRHLDRGDILVILQERPFPRRWRCGEHGPSPLFPALYGPAARSRSSPRPDRARRGARSGRPRPGDSCARSAGPRPRHGMRRGGGSLSGCCAAPPRSPPAASRWTSPMNTFTPAQPGRRSHSGRCCSCRRCRR